MPIASINPEKNNFPHCLRLWHAPTSASRPQKKHRTNDLCGGFFARVALASLDPEPGAFANEIKPYSERARQSPISIMEVSFLMKQTIKTSRTAGYLEKIFRELNAHYFNNEIEEPIITIQSTPRAYGHVTVSKAWHKSNGRAAPRTEPRRWHA